MTRRFVIATLVVIGMAIATAGLLLSACGGTSPAPTTTVTVAASPTSQPSPSPSATPQKVDAKSVFRQLKAAGLPLGKLVVYTTSTDPNHQLGRPTGYRSKVAFVDRRIKASEVLYTKSGDIARGGGIEVFKDASGAHARKKYLKAIMKAAPILGGEYDYIVGTVLVRVSDLLTPSQARHYRQAIEQ